MRATLLIDLKDNRADITWGGRAVLADVKWGGLRRDLSLAFEMDGDADITVKNGAGSWVSDPTTKFNQQAGEFVGNGDRYSGQYECTGDGGS